MILVRHTKQLKSILDQWSRLYFSLNTQQKYKSWTYYKYSFFYSNFRHKINKAGIREGQSKLPLVLDCSHISTADFTAANGFKAMITDFRRRNQPIIFYNTTPSVIDTFLGVNIEEFVVVHSLEELNEHLRGMY